MEKDVAEFDGADDENRFAWSLARSLMDASAARLRGREVPWSVAHILSARTLSTLSLLDALPPSPMAAASAAGGDALDGLLACVAASLAFSEAELQEHAHEAAIPGRMAALVGNAIREGDIRGMAILPSHATEEMLETARWLIGRDVLVLAAGTHATELRSAHGGKGMHRTAATASAEGFSFAPALRAHGEGAAALLLAEEVRASAGGRFLVAICGDISSPGALPLALSCMACGHAALVSNHRGVAVPPLALEVLTRTAKDLMGGRLLLSRDDLLLDLERQRAEAGVPHGQSLPAPERLPAPEIIERAIVGSQAAMAMAWRAFRAALARRGAGAPLEYPETAYELPCMYAWDGAGVTRIADIEGVLLRAARKVTEERTLENALRAGEATMMAAEAVEAMRYLGGANPYDGTPYCGFIPDRVLRELGLAFVDDTIPGAAVLLGEARDQKALLRTVRSLQSKGMLIIACGGVVRQLREEGVSMGLGMMLYPVGEFTQAVHGLNFAIRAALSFGGVQRGDRERLSAYLAKRPKVFALQYGPMDAVTASAGAAVMLNRIPIISTEDADTIPGLMLPVKDEAKMLQSGMEAREIVVVASEMDVPVPYGPAFEGETVRRPDTYLEAGGAAKTVAFELLRMLPGEEVEDGRIEVIGREVDEMPDGGSGPLALMVDVYGRKMQEDFEGVLERRIHHYLNFAEGVWHTGQRSMIWVRLAKKGVAAGLRLRHLGVILATKMKEEFGGIISRVQVKVITDGAEVKRLLPLAQEAYERRDARLAGLTDEAVDTFYSCLMCQSFAPDHICVITPERVGLCGAINWLDARTGKEIVPSGPNQPIAKGACIDASKGSWEGVNEAVASLTRGKLQRFNAYSLMEDPMTSCGCFEVIVAMTADMQAVIAVNREHAGMTPVGMKFSTLAGSIGGGKQTPGFIGVGRKYLTSRKFISAEGGFLRIAWMPKELKEAMRKELEARAAELGEEGFLDKVADETITTAEGLMEWMAKVGHPALAMPPLLS
jgi:acetyl-CoA synthase